LTRQEVLTLNDSIKASNLPLNNLFKGYIEGYPIELIDFVKNYEESVIVDGRHILHNNGRTIGYGHDLVGDENFGNSLSEQEAMDLLIKDLNEAYKKIVSRVNSLNNDGGYNIDISKFTENEMMFFVDFAYNRGVGLVNRGDFVDVPVLSLAILIAAVSEKDYAKVDKTLMEEVHNEKGIYYKGLELRRMDQYEILMFGDYERSGDIDRDYKNP
jgi:GH24 family phage-related lysozyme (muramidase)